MKINFFLLLIVLLFYSLSLLSQPQAQGEDFTILFYNVENLFDIRDEPGKEDDEFTPTGERYWTNRKLDKKLVNISKVILNSSGFTKPDVIALCEIENREVLERLLYSTPLKKYNYKIIHKESPDHRGIDVALLYRPETLYPLNYKYFPVVQGDEIIKTREVLYFSGIINELDTVHFFVNHWPSRYEGILESEPLRKLAAQLLKTKVEEVRSKSENSKIIILGDFNDQPTDASIRETLDAQSLSNNIENDRLYNLSFRWMEDEIKTLKYQSQWSVYDQCIVSGSLVNSKKGYSILPGNTKIIKLPFLLERDEKYGGVKPFRSYNGYSYKGGFSDHLPVLLKLTLLN
ncbi:endonuclease/exonuclease/phosphatase family protein [Maribellus maritimus]|uniref:endonuclease/exonuclease/phosphatase family protein n=1 Tax=Maribellus maritimus TaxID=2870838 RepID=UPI001EEB0337|nr:endonuclease/exonuclease/phosphatase family protein [Maribellus maritimus]MCG6185921.1 endonuclease/exonuclease/phosphatase family protein [Maribellus maritimus]